MSNNTLHLYEIIKDIQKGVLGQTKIEGLLLKMKGERSKMAGKGPDDWKSPLYKIHGSLKCEAST